jgi:SAM-dependent methyltransferase
MRAMDEYAPFADIYDEWSAEMTADIPFYAGLAAEADGPVVELAVGNGRVAIPVARETGRKLIGIDRSPSMLAQARERVTAAGLDIELREQDMRDFELDEQAALRPGGRFSWNTFVFDVKLAAGYSERLRRRPDGTTWEWTEYDPTDSRIDITAYIEQPGKDPRSLSLWWINRSEWEGLIDVAGLEVEALYGGFERQPFTEDSREFVWIARKPA